MESEANGQRGIEEMEANVVDDEEDVDRNLFMDEAREALRRRPASRPSEEEVRRHRATHLPFRD